MKTARKYNDVEEEGKRKKKDLESVKSFSRYTCTPN